MMINYNLEPLSINCNCQILLGNAVNKKFTNYPNSSLDSRIYDFESRTSHFYIVGKNITEVKLSTNYILDYLSGVYVFIEIYTSSPVCVCMVINTEFLRLSVPQLSELNDFNIKELFDNLRQEIAVERGAFSMKFLSFVQDYNSTNFRCQLLKFYSSQFIYDLLNYLKAIANGDNIINRQANEVKKIKDVLARIESELYRTCPTVNQMASMVGMSVSKFKLLFNQEFKETPHNYILDKKMIMARKLLQSGEYSISQVSYKVGFNHPSGFTRLFKNKFNYSPREFYDKNR